mgnify:CR=1 FL=1
MQRSRPSARSLVEFRHPSWCRFAYSFRTLNNCLLDTNEVIETVASPKIRSLYEFRMLLLRTH